MIKSFYKYICYFVYKRALISSKGISGIESRSKAYFSFLLLMAIMPGLILVLKFGSLILPNEKQRSLGILMYMIFFHIPSMLLISLLIKRSYLEKLTITEKEVKTNKRILWLIILAFLLYLIVKIIIVRGWY